MLFRPLPYSVPERLLELHESLPRQGIRRHPLSYPEFADWRAGARRTLADMAVSDHRFFNLSSGLEPEHLDGGAVSSSFFDVLGVRPHLGRDFRPEDDRPGSPRVVVLGHRLWQLRFGADPSTVGRVVRVNGEPATVIGVMPAGFEYPEFAKLWMPLSLDPDRESRSEHYLEGIARLRPGATLQSANAELEAVARRLEASHPETNTGVHATAVPLRDRLVQDSIRMALLLMLGAVGFVLAIACTNVANLLLARGVDRSREIALRTALGAGRGRLVSQLLAESLVLAVAGGAAGALLAVWGSDLIRSAVPVEIPAWIRLGMNGRALVYAAGVSLATSVVFGLAPALAAARVGVAPALKEGGRGGDEGRGRSRLRSGLVVGEMALSLVLLISAVLLVRSSLKLRAMDPGFDTRSALTLSLSLAGPAYDDPADRVAFYREAAERLGTVPGVERVGAVEYLPLLDSWSSSSFEVQGLSFARGEEPTATFHTVTSGYLDAMGIPLLAGRGFTERETQDPAATVAVVNQALAERFWHGRDPLGQRIRLDPERPWLTVVGVTRTLKRGLLMWDITKPEPEIYVPYAASPRRDMSVVVKTGGDPAELAPAVRDRLRGLDPDLPAFDVFTLDQYMDRVFWLPHFLGQMFGAFAVVALLLAAIGVYGVMAYSVSRRTHEIGVRVSLGARSADVLRLVIGQGMLLAALGVATGLAAALGVTRLLAGLLYDVSATDAATFIAIPITLSLVAFLASWLPARRAARVDPMTALRSL
jgi:putative ABC transport system permease protein